MSELKCFLYRLLWLSYVDSPLIAAVVVSVNERWTPVTLELIFLCCLFSKWIKLTDNSNLVLVLPSECLMSGTADRMSIKCDIWNLHRNWFIEFHFGWYRPHSCMKFKSKIINPAKSWHVIKHVSQRLVIISFIGIIFHCGVCLHWKKCYYFSCFKFLLFSWYFCHESAA